MDEKMRGIALVGSDTDTNINFPTRNSSPFKYHWGFWKEGERRELYLHNCAPRKAPLLRNTGGASCTANSLFAFEKNTFCSNHCWQYQKTPILEFVPLLPQLLSYRSLAKPILSCFLDYYLVAETPASCNRIKNKYVPASLSIVVPCAISCKPQTGLASPNTACRAGSFCACSKTTFHFETSACSFLLLFSAGTYVLLKKGGKCYAKQGSVLLNTKRHIMSHWLEICMTSTRIPRSKIRKKKKWQP